MIKTLLNIATTLILLCASQLDARPDFLFPQTGKTPPPPPKALFDYPNSGFEIHKINRLGLTITNSGFFGNGYLATSVDPETGDHIFGCEYPRNSNVEFLWVGGIWIGAVVGRDTLVSTAAEGYYNIVEFWPDAGAAGQMIRRSSQPFSNDYSPDAISEEDIICTFTDTFTHPSIVNTDPIDNRPHQPLNIEITQRTYAWSYPYADDFVLFDFSIRNIGVYPLKQAYIGIVNDADAYHISKSSGTDSWLDDICGFKKTIPSPIWPGYEDSIMVAWVADNDGDPNGTTFDFSSTTGVTASRVIRTPSDSLEYSFNWWVTQYSPTGDWGPRQVTDNKPYRDFGSNFGTPLGDKNKYYMLSTREFDYDQLECALSHTGGGWMAPDKDAEDFANGHNSIYLFSFGPFDLPPDSTLPVTLAYIGGEDLHHDPTAFENLYNPYNPGPFQNQLDFSNLGLNAIWAEWIYDNPGYDTDGDNDSGLARWFVNDAGTDSAYAFFKGDGVPDFRGAAPPPSPKLTVIPAFGKLILRWNGQVSENTIDVFSKEKDFEGYKVYFSESDQYADFVLAATYDKRDYNIHSWNDILRRWEISSSPISYDSIVAIYGIGIEPDEYTEDNPLPPNSSLNPTGRYTYFTAQFWNESDLSNPYGIHRVYPDSDPDDISDTTDDGFRRWYEYEFILDNISPSVPLYISVTAFDYGSRSHQLSELESSRLENATLSYPLASVDEVEEEGLNVIVYPNPYRIDGGYARAGYENRDRIKSAERARAINFANLPRICTIRIYTISGDLVKEIKHYRPDGGPDAQVETWNMLSRNTQVITSGIYIWSVDSEMGEQLGKLVIIK
ncbi:MAG: hypothetical protein R3F48_17940 [Candidatus Zixiibacteriota bacterium]